VGSNCDNRDIMKNLDKLKAYAGRVGVIVDITEGGGYIIVGNSVGTMAVAVGSVPEAFKWVTFLQKRK